VPQPDSSRITVALLSKLQQDAALLALMPDNAWLAQAPPGKQRFVVLQLLESGDRRGFGGRAWEAPLYAIEARALTTSPGNVHAAFARIDALLDPQPPLPPATLDIPGYRTRALYREAYIEGVEVDEIDPSIRWNRCGGHYRVWVTPQS